MTHSRHYMGGVVQTGASEKCSPFHAEATKVWNRTWKSRLNGYIVYLRLSITEVPRRSVERRRAWRNKGRRAGGYPVAASRMRFSTDKASASKGCVWHETEMAGFYSGSSAGCTAGDRKSTR